MSSRYLQIKDVTPDTPKHWCVKVQVVEKSPARKAMNGRTRFQRLILLDKEGTRVQASLFDDNISKFEDTLHILHKYEISNALVKPIDSRHRVVNNDYQWIINAKTPVIELHNDEESAAITPILSLVKFEDFYKYLDCQSQVDVLGAVIDVFPEKQIRKQDQPSCVARELLLINEENKPTKMTLWDHFVPNEGLVLASQLPEYPIVLAMRLRVVSYDGLSLSTRSGSSILINPKLSEVETLKKWVSLNTDIINESKERYSCGSQDRRTELLHKQVVKVSQIPPFPENGKLFAVFARPAITNKTQKFWYMGCKKCFKGIEAEYQKSFTCRYCKNTSTAEPRCRFEIEVSDDSGSISATVFGKNAEKMFPFTALMLMEEDIKVKKEPQSTKDYLIQLKATHSEYHDTTTVHFNVVSVSEC